MDAGETMLLLATLLSAFGLAIQYYSQVATYPLFAALPDGAFVPYHAAYERRLVWAVYVPFALTLAICAALLVVRPAGTGWAGPAAMLALNALIAPISVLVAVPTHIRLTRLGHVDAPGMRRLLTANALRLLASLLATAIGVWLIAGAWA